MPPARSAASPGTSSGPLFRPGHYVLERSRGRLVFGDGQHGRTPCQWAPKNVLAQRLPSSGGGDVGNVPASAIKQVLTGVAAKGVTNPCDAEGGADVEPTFSVLERVAARRCGTASQAVHGESDYEAQRARPRRRWQ